MKNLLKVKSIVTLLTTIALVVLLFVATPANDEIVSLFCACYGAIITYFFTKTDKDGN